MFSTGLRYARESGTGLRSGSDIEYGTGGVVVACADVLYGQYSSDVWYSGCDVQYGVEAVVMMSSTVVVTFSTGQVDRLQ
eukprot:1632667-Rhodomonas_salina.1